VRAISRSPFRGAGAREGPRGAVVLESGARLTADERVVYYQREEKQSDTNYVATMHVAIRPDLFTEFTTYDLSAPTAGVGEYFSPPRPTPDGKFFFFFARQDVATGILRIWTATTAPPGVELADIRELAGPVNDGESQSQPYVVPSGAMYFVGDRADGLSQVFKATRRTGDSYDKVEPVGGLGPMPMQFDRSPVVTADELTIYFSSDRLGPKLLSHTFVATRTAASSPFSNVRPLPELGSPGHEDSPNHVSAVGCRLYLTSWTSPSNYMSDILVATKPN